MEGLKQKFHLHYRYLNQGNPLILGIIQKPDWKVLKIHYLPNSQVLLSCFLGEKFQWGPCKMLPVHPHMQPFQNLVWTRATPTGQVHHSSQSLRQRRVKMAKFCRNWADNDGFWMRIRREPVVTFLVKYYFQYRKWDEKGSQACHTWLMVVHTRVYFFPRMELKPDDRTSHWNIIFPSFTDILCHRFHKAELRCRSRRWATTMKTRSVMTRSYTRQKKI